ncbi:major facilitator superfamily domain-containing protein [Crassisporium funariophilum]|nr:major facilitator superfamily domain-containing protein [Crassisporium funariophilum]
MSTSSQDQEQELYVEKSDLPSNGEPSVVELYLENAMGMGVLESKSEAEPTCQTHVERDEALDLLASAGGEVRYISAADDARLVRKIDRHLMPIMFGIYFLQLMDKQTLALSSVFGISKDAGLVGDEYSLLGSIVSIAQLVVQPLSAYLLVKLRLSIYVPVIVTCWGATLACMSAAHNFRGLLAARFFLGGFEASIQAAFILIGQMWYRRHEQGYRLAIWYSNNGWVNVFGSLIMFGVAHIKSKILHPYQLIFLLLGIVTFLVGLFSFLCFPDNLVRCKFLTTEEKIMAVERIRANQQGLETKTFKKEHVFEMLLDVKSWCWMFLMFTAAVPQGGIGAFGPLIIRGFGFDGYNVMLLMMPYGVLQLLFLFGGFWASRRYRIRSPIILVGLILCISASTLLLRTGRSKKDQPVLLAAYYMLAAHSLVSPIIINWQSSNVAGHTKKAATNAFMAMGSISGGIVSPHYLQMFLSKPLRAKVGPLLFAPKDKPYYHEGIGAMVGCFCACIGVLMVTFSWLLHLNKRNQRRRSVLGKGKMIDYSMLSAAEVEEERSKENTGIGRALSTGAHAFDDLTDLKNDEFIYVY